MMRLLPLIALSLAGATAAAAQSASPGPTQAELNAAHLNAADWLYVTGDYSGRRYVELDQIDTGNVGSLRPVCVFQAASDRAFHTNPLVYRGVMYLTTRHEAIALDARTCRVHWRRAWHEERRPSAQANRGLALKDGILVWGAGKRLLALDAETGAVRWDREHAGGRGESFTTAPLIYEDLVIIGPAGSEAGIAGWVGAFRLHDGEPVWRFNVVPRPGEPGAETWGDGAALAHGGGGVWTPMTLDPAAGHVYVGTANPAPDFDGRSRPGANLYTNSLVVLDARTGALQWYRQLVPHDVHDRGVTSPGPLFTLRTPAGERRFVATAGKDGVLRTIDRDTRVVVYETPVTTMLHTDRPPDEDGVRVCPGILGGVQWNGPAFHPGTGMLYVPSVDWCTTYRRGGDPSEWWSPYFGGTFRLDPVESSRGWLTAVDAASGEVRWRYASEAPMVGAVTTTAGGLVLTGEVTGDFLALDARDGRVLYRFNTGGAVGGGVVTYGIEGRQYVAVMSGGMTPFWERPPGSATVVVFSLPE